MGLRTQTQNAAFFERKGPERKPWPRAKSFQEDVNGEKLTVKKWWIFGADHFTVWCRFFHGLRRFFTVYKGHKRWNKKISLLMIFFTVSFSRFAPSLGKRFNRSLVRTGLWRGFWNRPWTLKTAERRGKSWKRRLLFSAPNSGMHQTLVQKRSDSRSLNRKKTIAMRFLNASVLERKSLDRNLSWGFPLGNLHP